MIDIHTHILPGIDDGAADIYDTLEMVRLAAESGVTAMVATPHCNIPGIYENYFNEEYVDLFHLVERAIAREGLPVEIYPGMEAFATHDLPELIGKGKIMPLNQSHYLLVEFDFGEEPEFAMDVLRRVHEGNAVPVIAHAERYEFVQDDPRIVCEWRRLGYPVQVNKGSMMGRFGRRARRAAYQLLDHNLVSVIASDAHGSIERTPYMRDAYEELSREYPEGYLQTLFEENPRRICADQPIVSFEPISFVDEY